MKRVNNIIVHIMLCTESPTLNIDFLMEDADLFIPFNKL